MDGCVCCVLINTADTDIQGKFTTGTIKSLFSYCAKKLKCISLGSQLLTKIQIIVWRPLGQNCHYYYRYLANLGPCNIPLHSVHRSQFTEQLGLCILCEDIDLSYYFCHTIYTMQCYWHISLIPLVVSGHCQWAKYHF